MLFIKKKSLGQHFLTSPAIAGKIADAAELTKKDTVLEVGPGNGILTKELLARAGKVIAVEKDDRLIETLKEEFKKEVDSKKLTLLHADALDFDISKYLKKRNFIVVANIPYYITGSLLRKLLTTDNTQPTTMVLLVQKEVAERIVAKKEKPLDSARGKESLLSLSIKAYGVPHIVGVVKRGSFSPSPSVDSAILRIENISKKNFTGLSEKHFFELLRAGFAHKRKFLLRNVGGIFGEKRVRGAFRACAIEEKARAENLPLEAWLALAYELRHEAVYKGHVYTERT